MEIKKVGIVCLVIPFVLINNMFGATRGGDIKPPFSKNFNYINQQIAFSVRGPDGWYGAMQNFGPDKRPLYSSFSKDTRVLYIKYSAEDEKARAFNPKFEIKIFPKTGYASAMDALTYYVDKVSSADFLKPPSAQRFGLCEWIICEYNISAAVNNKTLNIIRKAYLTIYKNDIILVQATDTEEEYRADVKLFDDAVSGIIFSDNYLDLAR